MPVRKLGRPTNQRIGILRNLTTALLQNGKIQTTEKRAKEVQKVVESVIALASKECDNFTSKEMTKIIAKKDSDGKKVTVSKESKNGNTYNVVERETVTELTVKDDPSRLHARRQIMKWVNKTKDEAVINKLFDEIAPKYKERKGGYTRMYKLGPRRGDAAPMAILELV